VRRNQLKGYQLYRQRIIGNYIVDFYGPWANLIIELDGGQHYTEEGVNKDKCRDAYMDNVKSYMKNGKIYERDIKGKSGIKRNYKFQQMSNEI